MKRLLNLIFLLNVLLTTTSQEDMLQTVRSKIDSIVYLKDTEKGPSR